jgi:hypothetical protein
MAVNRYTAIVVRLPSFCDLSKRNRENNFNFKLVKPSNRLGRVHMAVFYRNYVLQIDGTSCEMARQFFNSASLLPELPAFR